MNTTTDKKLFSLYQDFFKRFLDITLSIFALIMLSPLFLVIAILSKICLGGSIIFKQYRPGKNGKIFVLYKFRSMTNRKNKNGELLPDPDRVTKYGAFLRKTSLDELPQLVNILKGDMSIVGPRPRLVKDMVFYDKNVLRAYTVKPGLTGPTQVFDRHGGGSWDFVFQKDLEYVDHITFWGDTKMVILTFFSLFKSGNARTRKQIESMSREYYFCDELMKKKLISKKQYDLGLTITDELEKEMGIVTYQDELQGSVKENEK